MTVTKTQRFPYGPKGRTLLLSGFFFVVSGVVLLYAASSGKTVRLGPLEMAGAPVYLLAVTAFGFPVLAGAVAFRARSLGPRELVICAKHIEAPASPWTARTVRITRAEVRSSRVTDVMGTRVVEILADGKKLALSNRNVGADGYEAVTAWLVALGARERDD